jgi:hypothetical protein
VRSRYNFSLFSFAEPVFNRDRLPWYDTLLSYNPAIHRTKQALFHSAVVNDIASNPLPPPHPELLKYIEPPRRVLKHAQDAIAECKAAFKVKEGTHLITNHLIFNLTLIPYLFSTKESRKSPQRRPRSRKRRR